MSSNFETSVETERQKDRDCEEGSGSNFSGKDTPWGSRVVVEGGFPGPSQETGMTR